MKKIDRHREISDILDGILDRAAPKYGGGSLSESSEKCLVIVNSDSEKLCRSALILHSECREFMTEVKLGLAMSGIQENEDVSFREVERTVSSFRELWELTVSIKPSTDTRTFFQPIESRDAPKGTRKFKTLEIRILDEP